MDIRDATSEKVIHHFQFPCGLVPVHIFKEMVARAGVTPLIPTGLIITIRTKDKGCLLHLITDSILKTLRDSGLVDVPSIRQISVSRQSSFEETVDLHIVVLSD